MSLSLGRSSIRQQSQSLLPQCQICAKRMASKAASKRGNLLEVELTQNVQHLGRASSRVQVAPGHMRNHLYPKRMALYVIRGRTLGLDGKLGPLPAPPTTSSTQDPSTSSNVLNELKSRKAEIDEAKVLEQISLLGPLQFARRTTGQYILHGSVTVQDVQNVLLERGIQLQELEGTFTASEGKKGVENGRIKRLGEYIFNVKLPSTTSPIVINVVKEA